MLFNTDNNKEKIIMAKEKFTRGKPLCNIRIIGQNSNTLAAAISKLFDGTSSTTSTSSYIEFDTETRHYCLGYGQMSSQNFLKTLATERAKIDGLIFSISVRDGLMPQIKEQFLLLHQLGFSKAIVFFDDVDKVRDPELLDLLEMETRDLLSKYDFDGDNTPVVRGSSQKALNGDTTYQNTIKELMDACDSYIPLPPSDADKPFLLPIEDIFTITGRGTVVTGRIERGTVCLNDKVACIGLNKDAEYIVTGIEMFRKMIDKAQAGDNVAILLRGADKNNLARGMVLAAPGSIYAHTKFRANIYILTKEEGGRHTPFFNNYRPQFYFRTTDVTGTIQLPDGISMGIPGNTLSIAVELILPIAMEKGTTFYIREGGRTVGNGTVTEILDNEPASIPIAVIEDVFTITGRGTVITATVKSGVFRVGDKIKFVGSSDEIGMVTSIMIQNKQIDEAKKGDTVGLLIRGGSRDQIKRGMEITTMN